MLLGKVIGVGGRNAATRKATLDSSIAEDNQGIGVVLELDDTQDPSSQLFCMWIR